MTSYHPPCEVVLDSAAPLVLCDQLALRFGTDWLVSSNKANLREFPLKGSI